MTILIENLPKARCCGGTTLRVYSNGDGSFGGECAECKLYCTNSHNTPGKVIDEWLSTPNHYIARNEEDAKKARREYRRKYDAEHRDKLNSYHRKWRKENPDKVAAAQERYWTKRLRENNE